MSRMETSVAAVRYRKPPELARLGARHAVVEASAGTGKTYLLEHLVMDLLLTRGATLEQILVVTFTEKATAELVDRVRRKLEELASLVEDHPNAAGAPDADCWLIDERARRRLREAIQGFDRASISTIHAFCQRLLAEHAFANRRLFDEQTIDEDQAFASAFAETLRRDVAPDPQLSRYLALWLAEGGTGIGGLRRALQAASRKLACAQPRGPELLQPADDEAALIKAGRDFLAAVPAGDLKESLKRDGIHANTVRAIIDRLGAVRAGLEPCADSDDPLVWLAALARLDRKPRLERATLAEQLTKNAGAGSLSRLRVAFEELDQRGSLLGVVVARLLPVLERRLEAHKREAGRFDFQDMLTLVARTLAGGESGEGQGDADAEGAQRLLLETLRARYRYALIDEFQDTDEVQWSIFRRIFFESGAGHVLTVIGDPKQAIYSFRGADVYTYLRARQAIEDSGGERLHLAANYRSSAPLIAAYNAILDDSAPFFRPAGGIRYDHPVTCGRPELTLVDAAGERAPSVVVLDVVTEAASLLTYQVKGALLPRITQEIRSLLGGPTALRFGAATSGAAPARLQPLRPGDVYVLTRTTRESREVGDALREAGVPFAYFKQEKLFATVEAREVLDVLRAIAEPEDATARGRAFITPFFGLGLVDLAACDDLDASDGLYRRLHHWRALAESGHFERLFAELIDGSGIVCRELFFKDTERSLTNYLHLLEILQEEAARTRATIRELAQTLGAYIAGTRRPPGDARDIQRLESDADAVQIMTIHHAKGLEAPVVFVYGGFWPGPSTDVRAFHDQAGRRVVRVGRPSAEDKQRYADEQDDEERRVLYVALTRAKARLYLPRFPKKAFTKLLGAYRFIDQRLHDLGGGFCPAEIKALFDVRPVPCPAPAATAVTDAPAAVLAAWQPPSQAWASDALDASADAQARAVGLSRAGFMMTSYSAVKRRQSSRQPLTLADAEDAVSSTEAPSAAMAPLAAGTDQLADDELPRGRLSGLFLHGVLEEAPLASFTETPEPESWAVRPDIAALIERQRQRHDQAPRHVPHAARLIHTALAAPTALGDRTIGSLAGAERILREMEFLYPIPERGHRLLTPTAPADPHSDKAPFRIQRGVVKGYIDLLFENRGRTYLCDWKGDWLPRWDSAEVEAHCQRHYDLQAQLYTLAALRLLEIGDADDYDERFGGTVYVFLRGRRPDDPRAGVYFHRPAFSEVLAWQESMLDDRFWRLG